eukprot:TRINITY_DN104426_c0_g1_i1.p1 TRINITY_DN104426_c0_g1~~TRINITY_DN104426_c0_g1_i1.p1  ORF type:complete len:524 (+),score=47.40 TRINITY_DN104426_c0_g1_i1:25-1572(+)
MWAVSFLEKGLGVNITGTDEEKETEDPKSPDTITEDETANVTLGAPAATKLAQEEKKDTGTFSVLPETSTTMTGRMLQSIQQYVNITGEKAEEQAPMTNQLLRDVERIFGVDITGSTEPTSSNSPDGSPKQPPRKLTPEELLKLLFEVIENDTFTTFIYCVTKQDYMNSDSSASKTTEQSATTKQSCGLSVSLLIRIATFMAPDSVLLVHQHGKRRGALSPIRFLGAGGVVRRADDAPQLEVLEIEGVQKPGVVSIEAGIGVLAAGHHSGRTVVATDTGVYENGERKIEFKNGAKSFNGLAVGADFTVVIVDGGLLGWGNNSKGQLGLGKTVESTDEPKKIELPFDDGEKPQDPDSVAVGEAHLLVRCVDGRVYSCGCNDKGQLGLGHEETEYELQPVTALTDKGVTTISAGGTGSLVVGTKGMYSFGGIEGTPSQPLPVLVDLGLEDASLLQLCGLTRKMIWLFAGGECHASDESGVFTEVQTGGRQIRGVTSVGNSALLLQLRAVPQAVVDWW